MRGEILNFKIPDGTRKTQESEQSNLLGGPLMSMKAPHSQAELSPASPELVEVWASKVCRENEWLSPDDLQLPCDGLQSWGG